MVLNPEHDLFSTGIFYVVCGLWNVPKPHNGTLRQSFIVATIRYDFFFLYVAIATLIHIAVAI